MNQRLTTRQIRYQLKHTWLPFLSRFGRLTPIQELTIPKILAGVNIVACAPTASGKTESVVVPVAERCMAEKWQNISVLYIVPTRALANDVLARIGNSLDDMGLKTQLKHGDRPYLSKNLPDWLITTPESLDSMICRRSHIFKTLRTVIIDEIHLLDNTYRGDQLRLLLIRLKQIVDHSSLGIHLLSATLPNPDKVAQRYVENFEVIQVSGQRGIEHQFAESHQEIIAIAKQKRYKKLLYFCNFRDSVEQVGKALIPLWKPYPVVVHHGSLDRKIREEAEEVMQQSKTAICVATSTLEIGIDIGNIDLVVLAEPPFSIEALLQRIGRGNRRSGTVKVIAIASSTKEREHLESMFELAINGEFNPEEYEPNLSVVIQQIFSYLYQFRSGVSQDQLFSLFNCFCSQDKIEKILTNLLQLNWILCDNNKIYPSEELLTEGDKGKIHSNIPDQGTFKVIDIDSNLEVGMVSSEVDDVFLLAQRAWKVIAIDNNIIKAKKFNGKVKSTSFKKHRNLGKFDYLL